MPASSAATGNCSTVIAVTTRAPSIWPARCARRLKVPLHFATITRLLVEINRSANHPRQFSVATESLSAAEREALFAKHYFPYRRAR